MLIVVRNVKFLSSLIKVDQFTAEIVILSEEDKEEDIRLTSQDLSFHPPGFFSRIRKKMGLHGWRYRHSIRNKRNPNGFSEMRAIVGSESSKFVVFG